MEYKATIIGKKKTQNAFLYNVQYETNNIEGYAVHTLFSKNNFPLFSEAKLNVFKKGEQYIYYLKKG